MKTKSTPNQIKAKLGLHGVSDPASAQRADGGGQDYFLAGQGYFLEDKAISRRTRLFPGGQGHFLEEEHGAVFVWISG